MDANRGEIARLELLADVDALAGRLERWAENAPDWQPAESARALIRRLAARAEKLKLRLDAPLVVATLGGTGTGKSTLINALVGCEVTAAGRSRPTTNRPAMICRRDITPEMLGIDPRAVDLHQHDLPSLAELVLIDCPDPDTTEEVSQQDNSPEVSGGTNLQRLRAILPHCDVLLVTTTQQKYRSAKVSDELAAAAAGARLVFVQTHADLDEDVREDWRHVLSGRYASGDIFLVDSPAALADACEGREPKGQFAQLLKLLTSELAGAAGNRIRRANFLDLVANTLDGCQRRIDEQMPPIEQVETAIEQQRARFAQQMAGQTRDELLSSRRQWEHRLLTAVTSRWGFSPFALLLRLFQGLGGLISGAMVWRARTPAQMALWGAVGGMQTWQKYRKRRLAEQGVDRAAAAGWTRADLTEAALILAG
ncbi:MAG: GTPase domain-containing protein, partial [Thermoguttaceae bacterium]